MSRTISPLRHFEALEAKKLMTADLGFADPMLEPMPSETVEMQEQSVGELASADEPVAYLKYKLDRVFIKSWSTSGDADDRPTEEVAIEKSEPGSVMTADQTAADGQPVTYLKYKLDRAFIKSWSISGDADDRPTEEVEQSDKAYETDDWFVADSFSFGVERQQMDGGLDAGAADTVFGIGNLQECTISKSMDSASLLKK